MSLLTKVKKLLFPTKQLSGGEILEKLDSEYQRRTKLVTSVVISGLLLFIMAASLAPFRDQIFSIIYQKPSSYATQQEKVEFKDQISEEEPGVLTVILKFWQELLSNFLNH